MIVLYMSGQEARTVLDSVKRNWRLDNKSIVWIAPDQWGTSSYFLNGLFNYRHCLDFVDMRLLLMTIFLVYNESCL